LKLMTYNLGSTGSRRYHYKSESAEQGERVRSRGLAIVAVAALTGAALAAAVTLPALIVSGDDSPPAALSLAPGSKRVVVRAAPLPAPRIVTRRAPGELAPPAPVSPTQSSVSALASAPGSGSGPTGSGSREALGTPRHAKPAKRAERPVPTPTVLAPAPPAPPPTPPPPPPPPPESRGHKEKPSKKPKHQQGSKSKHKEKNHGHGQGKGEGQKEHDHGHGDEGDNGHGPKR
jgi:hypothetical protein